MAISSTGTSVSDGVYTTLFEANAPYGAGSDGGARRIVNIRVVSGTATIKITPGYTAAARTMSSSDDTWQFIATNDYPVGITKIEAAGSGASASVAFWFSN